MNNLHNSRNNTAQSHIFLVCH